MEARGTGFLSGPHPRPFHNEGKSARLSPGLQLAPAPGKAPGETGLGAEGGQGPDSPHWKCCMSFVPGAGGWMEALLQPHSPHVHTLSPFPLLLSRGASVLSRTAGGLFRSDLPSLTGSHRAPLRKPWEAASLDFGTWPWSASCNEATGLPGRKFWEGKPQSSFSAPSMPQHAR